VHKASLKALMAVIIEDSGLDNVLSVIAAWCVNKGNEWDRLWHDEQNMYYRGRREAFYDLSTNLFDVVDIAAGVGDDNG
jgi:hypothetical protein